MTFAGDLARDRPHETALRDPERSMTWAQVDDYLRAPVNALARTSMRDSRRVAVFAANSAETLLAYVTCTLAGASGVAVNAHLTAAETRFILEDADVDVVLCDPAHAEIAAQAADGTGVRLIVGWGGVDLPAGIRPWADWCGEAGDAEPRTDLEPRRTLVYTSGTTGRPKGVELPYSSWVGGHDVTEHVRRLGGNRMISFGRHLVVGPMYHSGPLAGTRLFLGGAPVTVLGKYDATALLTVIDRDRIGSSIMVPTHFQRLLDLPAEVRNQFDHTSLRYVLQVGAKCPESVKRAMIDWWGPVVWESYGASEVGTTCMISAEEWLRHPGSVGRAVVPFEAFIRLPDGSDAAPGTEGELWFRDTNGHGITYLSGAGTDETFTLGEIGVMNDDGYVWVTDRAADLVVSGGVNIYPAEVEQALLAHSQVADVACYGVADPEMGERLVAVVVSSGGERPTVEKLRSFCRQHLAGYKCPKEIYFADELARTAVGKLDKRTIRATYSRTPTHASA
ncbi:AMP-binding protein [Rhodococcus opacus]|nr:AMP-binding protein [Rhodococcus opacus]